MHLISRTGHWLSRLALFAGWIFASVYVVFFMYRLTRLVNTRNPLTSTPPAAAALSNASASFAIFGRAAAFRGYLNDEAYQMFELISSNRHWTPLAAEKRPGTGCDWATLGGHDVILKDQQPPTVLLFVLRFHWNYAAMARLGSRASAACKKIAGTKM